MTIGWWRKWCSKPWMDKTGEDDRAESEWTTSKNSVEQTCTFHSVGPLRVETSCCGGIGQQQMQVHGMKKMWLQSAIAKICRNWFYVLNM